MSDETFCQDFMWYEWSFIAPEDLPSNDLEVTGDTFDAAGAPQPPRVQEQSDVWPMYR